MTIFEVEDTSVSSEPASSQGGGAPDAEITADDVEAIKNRFLEQHPELTPVEREILTCLDSIMRDNENLRDVLSNVTIKVLRIEQLLLRIRGELV